MRAQASSGSVTPDAAKRLSEQARWGNLYDGFEFNDRDIPLKLSIRPGRERQYGQDIPIWENKQYLTKPMLADGDGPLPVYRRWMRQFFSEQW